jgi:small subunit ribosomal protein S17
MSAHALRKGKHMAQIEEKSETVAKTKRTKTGVVVSNKMQKTVVVAVENLVRHPMYQKYVKRTNKFLAHNERTDINIGDRVVIEETRPLSKRKRWNLREVLEKAS